MSIITVFMGDESALVGVDTATFAPDGSVASVTKFVPLAHMGALIAYRGYPLFLETLFGYCHMQGGDLDGLLEKMPEILGVSFKQFLIGASQLGFIDQADLDAHNVVIVGWSPKHGRMICQAYDQERRTDGFGCKAIESWYSAPGVAAVYQMPEIRNLAVLKQVTRTQIQLLNTQAPGAAAGGRLMVAALARGRINIFDAGELPTTVRS